MAANLGFVLNVFPEHDEELAQRLIVQLMANFPGAPISVITDGKLANSAAFQKDIIAYHEGVPLKQRRTGGLWTQRMLQQGLGLDTEYVVKLDPDSYIHRPFAVLPEGDLAGERKLTPWGTPYIRGGCIVFKRDAIRTMLDSNYLLDPLYTRADLYCYRHYADNRLVALTDYIIGSVAERCELSVEDWHEVSGGIYGTWDLVPDNPNDQWAITHPVMLTPRAQAVRQAMCVPGFMSKSELGWLYDRAEGNVVEVGTYYGRSAVAIASKLKQNGGFLTCVDPWQDFVSEGGKLIKGSQAFVPFQANMETLALPVTWIRGRSPDVASRWQDGSLDMVFLDGDHSVEGVTADIKNWRGKLKPGGLLCGHDYLIERPGVLKAVKSLLPGFSVKDTIWYSRVFL